MCREFKILTPMVDERISCVCSIGRLDLADEDRMIAAIVHRDDPAVEVAEAVVEDGRPADRVMVRKAMKPIDNPGLPAAEAIGQLALLLVEQIDGKMARLDDQIVDLATPGYTDEQQRRSQ